MKKVIVIMFVMLMQLLIFGCSGIEDGTESISKEIDEYIEDYISSHELNPISSVDNEVEKVIAYSNNENSGLVFFKYDDEIEKVSSQNIVSNWDGLEQVSYSQIQGRKENYVGLFIRQDTTLTNSSNIKVTFSESVDGEADSIIQTLYGKKVLIMTYNSEDGLKEIEEIQLLHQDGGSLSN